MKKTAFLLIMLLFGFHCLMGAPFKNIPVQLKQPDGKMVNCFASGDEFYNYLHDADGFTIVQGESGFYYYATRGNRGEVAASQYIVGEVDPASMGLEPYVKISEEEYYSRRHKWESPLTSHLTRFTSLRATPFSPLTSRKFPNGRELNHGLYNNLVVFIRFAGDTYHNTPFSTVEEMFNADGWEDVSLHNFYHHSSYNQIDLWSYFYPQPDGETVLSYEDIYPKQYYQPYNAVTNPIGYLDENRAEREFDLLERAIEYIEDMVPEDLDLDYNGDGKVDNVVFVCKGETGEWNSLLWPHRWFIFDRYVTLHGLQVYDFNLQLEQGGYFNVSTLCHEMFHSLGAPDLYHYTSGGIDPVGSWDLMCSNTEPPQQMNSYMKYKYGNWIEEIPVINATGTYELESVAWEGGHRNGYMIPTSDPYQYFFIEYRNRHNIFDNKIPGSGLLIYLIDTRFDGNAGWDGNENLDEVYIFRPGGDENNTGNLDHAFFSAESGRTSFNIGTDPHPFIHNQPYAVYDWLAQITNISGTGDRMSFDYMPYGGEGSAPGPDHFVAHVNRLEHQVELSWNANPYAGWYNVYRDGAFISEVTDTTFVYPYTEADHGFHIFSVLSVDAGLMHVYTAESKSWVILGNYETIHLSLSCNSPYGTKGGELEVSYDNPAMKAQYLTVYRDTKAETDIYVPANTEVTFRWLSGFDPEGQGIHVEATHYNENGQGSIFAIDNPNEGVLATYTAADEGLGYMHPQHFTAVSDGTDVQLRWTLPVEVNGVRIFRDGICCQDNVMGSEYLDNKVLRSGSHAYQVESTCGSATSWNPEDIVYATVMNYYCEPPHLVGQHSDNSNELRWEAPQFAGHGMLAYDNHVFMEQFGSSNYKWGIKILPENLSLFEGHPLTHIEMFDGASGDYTFNIYNGENATNNTLIYTQQHTMTGSNQWVRFALDEQVPFDATLPLWITVSSTGVEHPIPCCEYVGNPNSCLIKSGTQWKPVTNYHLYYSWLLHAYTTPIETPSDFTYNLYWGPEEGHDYEMALGMENLSATTAIHNTNENTRYNVTAVWNGRETDFSNNVYLGPSVEIETLIGNEETKVFPNPTKGLLTIQSTDLRHITLYNIIGQVVYDTSVDAETVTLDLSQYSAGMYLIRIDTGNGTSSQKVSVTK